MQPLDLARIYASHVADEKKTTHQQALQKPRNHLEYWVATLLDCKTLSEVRELLVQFSEMQCWDITEKALMSSHYTPKVLKLMSSYDADDKTKWLDDLAELCWKPGGKACQ